MVLEGLGGGGGGAKESTPDEPRGAKPIPRVGVTDPGRGLAMAAFEEAVAVVDEGGGGKAALAAEKGDRAVPEGGEEDETTELGVRAVEAEGGGGVAFEVEGGGVAFEVEGGSSREGFKLKELEARANGSSFSEVFSDDDESKDLLSGIGGGAIVDDEAAGAAVNKEAAGAAVDNDESAGPVDDDDDNVVCCCCCCWGSKIEMIFGWSSVICAMGVGVGVSF